MGEFEDDPCSTDPMKWIERRNLRIDDSISRRQYLESFVMIGDDDIQSDVFRMHDFLDAGDTIIDGDDEVMSLCLDSIDMMDFETIAICESIRIHDLDTPMTKIVMEESIEEKTRCHTIDIVVAEDTDRFFIFDRSDDTICADVHILKEIRIVSILGHIRIEKIVMCTGNASIV